MYEPQGTLTDTLLPLELATPITLGEERGTLADPPGKNGGPQWCIRLNNTRTWHCNTDVVVISSNIIRTFWKGVKMVPKNPVSHCLRPTSKRQACPSLQTGSWQEAVTK